MYKRILPMVVICCMACSEKTDNPQLEIIDKEALSVVDRSAVLEELANGYDWTEGPVYVKNGDFLLFSDIPRNKVYKWKDGEGASLYLDSSGYIGTEMPKNEPGSNGLLIDHQGKLVLCQHGMRRVARMDADVSSPAPVYSVIVDRYEGKRLNSPNDAAVHSNGDIYFTDPPYGLDQRNRDSAMEQPVHGVYRVKPDGAIDLLTGEFDYPNGIAFSPDEQYLYVAHSDPENMKWMKYKLNEQGTIAEKSEFYRINKDEKQLPGLPDGLKVNSKGYVFASGPGGIWIFNPSGTLIARIYTGQATSNCALSADEKTLFMTCDSIIYKMKLK